MTNCHGLSETNNNGHENRMRKSPKKQLPGNNQENKQIYYKENVMLDYHA